jgi:hypothetical protein
MPHYREWIISGIRQAIQPQRAVKSSTTEGSETAGMSKKEKGEETQSELKHLLKPIVQYPDSSSSRLGE